jgi:hypothetical protein
MEWESQYTHNVVRIEGVIDGANVGL